MTQDVAKPGTSTAAVPLTDQQAVVLQAIYDHFREHGTWPTFITIDRPIRRERRWDTGAILLGLPESLIVEPRPGHLRPIERDELRLRLLGIQACEGSSDDTARFVRTLRWLAEREETYEPPPGSSDEMPQVTSQEIADHLGLDGADELSLQRIYAMLQLDHWGLGGSGSNDDSWYVRLGQDIWRFRDVQTIEDVIAAREAWLAEGRPVTAQVSAPEGSPWYHIAITTNSSPENSLSRLDLSHDELESQFLAPYREGRPLMTNGRVVRPDDIRLIQITQTEQSFEELRSRSRSLIGQVRARALTEWGVVATNGTDVTDDFITGAPGQPAVEATEVERLAPPAQIAAPYVDAKVIAAIQAKDGQSTFDVTKLLALIAELNDNCARSNTYASHTLLRGLLDHIPPILSCKNFEEVANNYRWPQTDKKYLKQLAAFRAQGDDALHRQISADADLLGFDDMPKSVCVDRLLLECAKKL